MALSDFIDFSFLTAYMRMLSLGFYYWEDSSLHPIALGTFGLEMRIARGMSTKQHRLYKSLNDLTFLTGSNIEVVSWLKMMLCPINAFILPNRKRMVFN